MGCKIYKIKIAIAESLENNFIRFLVSDCGPFIIKCARTTKVTKLCNGKQVITTRIHKENIGKG
jgi:hypothetical protein